MLLHSLGVCTLYSVRPCRNLPFTDTLGKLGCLQHAGLLSTIFGDDVGEDEEIGLPIYFPAIGPLFSVT